MKKKLITLITSLVCVVSCAIGLAACGTTNIGDAPNNSDLQTITANQALEYTNEMLSGINDLTNAEITLNVEMESSYKNSDSPEPYNYKMFTSTKFLQVENRFYADKNRKYGDSGSSEFSMFRDYEFYRRICEGEDESFTYHAFDDATTTETYLHSSVGFEQELVYWKTETERLASYDSTSGEPFLSYFHSEAFNNPVFDIKGSKSDSLFRLSFQISGTLYVESWNEEKVDAYDALYKFDLNINSSAGLSEKDFEQIPKNTDDSAGSKGLIFNLNADKTSYSLVALGNCQDEDIVIPDSFNNLPITGIYGSAFENTSFKTITLSKNISDADTALIDAPYSLKYIAADEENETYASVDGVLYDKEKQRVVCVPKSICGNITIPGSVKDLGRSFSHLNNLTGITLGNGITSIPDRAFQYCRSLAKITIPDSVTFISNAFDDCTLLTSITIPSSVVKMYPAFENCYALTVYCEAAERPYDWSEKWNKVSGNGYDTVYCPVVWDCKNNDKDENGYAYVIADEIRYALKDGNATVTRQIDNLSGDIAIPTAITYKGESYNVTGISNNAFWHCHSLTSITIPDSVVSIKGDCFPIHSDKFKYNEYNHGNYLGNNTNPYLALISTDWNAVSVTVHKDTKIISSGAFSAHGEITNVSIPDGISRIEDETFCGCFNLSSINIPNDVTYIGDSAFSNCRSLTEIVIPDNVKHIGDNAFFACDLLTRIVLGNGIESIGWNAFEYNPRHNELQYNKYDNAYYLGNDVNPYVALIKADNYISSCTIHENTKIILDLAFISCAGLTDIAIPNKVTNIGSSAFNRCSGLTSITIPDSVTSIDSSAFSGCSGLTSIAVASGNTYYHSNGNCLIETKSKTLIAGCKNSVIPTDGSVTSIGNYAFSGCNGLTSIAIPESVKSIGEYAFSGCSGLTSIAVASGNTYYHSNGNCLIETKSKTLIAGCKNSVIPTDGSVTSIGNYAFGGCHGLTSIAIPESVKSIGEYAFYDCSNLTSITIPNSVTEIELGAFNDCKGLISVTFNGTKEQWNRIIKSYNYSWVSSTGDYTVTCTDGKLDKNGNEIID